MRFLVLFFLIFAFGYLSAQDVPNNEVDYNFDEQFELAKSLIKTGDVDKAVKIYYSILDHLNETNDDSYSHYTQLAQVLQSLTNVYLFENDSISLNYANLAITAAEKTNDYRLIERSYSFKYYCLYYNPDSAIQLNKIADKCIEYSLLVSDNKKILGEAYMHKCNALVELGKIEEGNSYCLKAEKIFAEIERGYFLSSVLGNIANVFVKSNQIDKALSYHLKSFDVSKDLDNLEYLLNDAKNIAEDYYKLGKYKKSAEYYKIVTDSIEASYKNKLNTKFTEAEAKFNTEQKDKEIAIQKLNVAQQKQTRNQIIIIGLFSLFILIAFFQWFLLKNKKKKQLAQQELIKEQQLNTMRKRFLENIAHEIRTPITLIVGHLALALENNDNNQVTKHITSAINNSEKVLDNANEILEIQKLESGSLPLENTNIELNTFLKRVYYSFESLTEIKSIKLKYSSNIEPGMGIYSDKSRFEKILNNLISNAIKFSPSNSQIIFKSSIENDKLVISISDSGPGVKNKEKKKIFDRFYQTPGNPNIGGIGVGLSLVKELITSLGGKVWVDSEPGEGATFVISLPIKVIMINEKIPEENTESKTFKVKSKNISFDDKPKLLIVEDNPEMNAYLSDILCKQFICDVAFDGIEGLQKVQTKKYDLIISDVMMPQIDGFELKKRINQLNFYKNIPFIFITAKAQLSDRIEGYSLGIDDYITKPFVKEELLARINNLLVNKKERDEWAKNNPDIVDRNTTSDEQLLIKIKIIIKTNLSNEDFKVSELAEQVSYSTRQLNRLLKELTGLSPVQFILEMRLLKAYACFSEKMFPTISEVRNYVGIPSAAHFSKKFVERFGIKPSDLLK